MIRTSTCPASPASGALAAIAFLLIPLLSLALASFDARGAPGAAAATSTAAGGRSSPAACSWDHPGRDPFTGDVPAAVDRYTDLSPEVRERLKARMRAHDYDDLVEISRDRISGHAGYQPQIRDMHFGTGRVCAAVSRERWSDEQRERALVYCEGQTCVMVPTVCRNVSRIARAPGGGPGGDGELLFDPPGAGAPTPVPEGVPLMLTPAPLPELLPGVSPVPLRPPGALAAPPALTISPPGGPPAAVLQPPPLYTLPPRAAEPPIGPPVIPPISPVPEPSSLAMTAAGLALLAALVARVRSRASKASSSRPPCRNA